MHDFTFHLKAKISLRQIRSSKICLWFFVFVFVFVLVFFVVRLATSEIGKENIEWCDCQLVVINIFEDGATKQNRLAELLVAKKENLS